MSTLYKLGWRDFVKGAVLAVAAAVLVVVQGAVASNSAIDWSVVLQVAEGAFVSYVLKNYFSDESGKLLGKL
jgi:hypothetical protein